jgi:hypothetical protein
LRQAREQRERGEKVILDYEMAEQQDRIESTERILDSFPFHESVMIRRDICNMSSRLEYRVKRRTREES